MWGVQTQIVIIFWRNWTKSDAKSVQKSDYQVEVGALTLVDSSPVKRSTAPKPHYFWCFWVDLRRASALVPWRAYHEVTLWRLLDFVWFAELWQQPAVPRLPEPSSIGGQTGFLQKGESFLVGGGERVIKDQDWLQGKMICDLVNVDCMCLKVVHSVYFSTSYFLFQFPTQKGEVLSQFINVISTADAICSIPKVAFSKALLDYVIRANWKNSRAQTGSVFERWKEKPRDKIRPRLKWREGEKSENTWPSCIPPYQCPWCCNNTNSVLVPCQNGIEMDWCKCWKQHNYKNGEYMEYLAIMIACSQLSLLTTSWQLFETQTIRRSASTLKFIII